MLLYGLNGRFKLYSKCFFNYVFLKKPETLNYHVFVCIQNNVFSFYSQGRAFYFILEASLS